MLVVFVQQEKFLKKFGDEGVGPPFPNPFQSYPPPDHGQKQGMGGCKRVNGLVYFVTGEYRNGRKGET